MFRANIDVYSMCSFVYLNMYLFRFVADIHLGGEDFDHKVAEYFAAEAVAQGMHTYYLWAVCWSCVFKPLSFENRSECLRWIQILQGDYLSRFLVLRLLNTDVCPCLLLFLSAVLLIQLFLRLLSTFIGFPDLTGDDRTMLRFRVEAERVLDSSLLFSHASAALSYIIFSIFFFVFALSSLSFLISLLFLSSYSF